MQWSATVGIVVFIVFVGSVKGILVFSFTAIVSFIFARSLLLDGKSRLDFTQYFASKGLGLTKEKGALSITTRRFPRGLKFYRHALIRNILRDFVISWYENVAIGGDFIVETRSLLEEATVSFYDKLSRTTVNSHTEKLCLLLNRHLSATQAARMSMQENHKSFIETYSLSPGENRGYQNDELQYLRSVIDLLLYKLVAPKTLGCNTGRFILREILAVKLLLPLVDTISDPDFVNTSIIKIFRENSDENPLATSLGNSEASELNLKTTSFMEYLDQSLNNSNDSSKSVQSEPETKYKFENATVIEKDHSEIVELSIEADSQENNDTSSLVKLDDSTVGPPETTDKTIGSSLSKKPKPPAKEVSHSSVMNGFTKLKNDLFKTNKEQRQTSKPNVILATRIHPSGMMLARQLRKIQSSPVIKQSAGVNLEESAPLGENSSDYDVGLDSSKDGGNCSSLDDNGIEIKTGETIHESRSLPKFISNPVEPEPVVSSFEDIDMHNIPETHVAPLPDNGSPTNDSKTVQQTKSEVLLDDEKRLTQRTRRHTTSFSSTDEWDSEVFVEKEEEDGLVFDVGSDFLHTGADNVSRADFAIHDVPNPCSMVTIPSTELITEPHAFEPVKSRYTVYVIVYQTRLWPHSESDDSPEKKTEADGQGTIKRRYREFMELHHRLLCGSFAPLMKDIPKPNRKFNSPFFRLDQDVVEGRQLLLENYLKCLVTKPAILNCKDFKGFLGIGNESQTDFRRHLVPTLPNVPRIDIKLQKKMTKIIGHIKTAFDTGPVEGDKEEEYENIRKVLGEDKTSPDEIRTFVISSEGCDKLNNSCCHSENSFRTFIQQHHCDGDFPETLEQRREDPAATHSNSEKTDRDKNGKCVLDSCDNQDKERTNPLTRTVLNLSCHLLEKHESWVCLEPVQEAATAVFGCFLEWWMQSLLSELVTEEQWQYYLTLLTDTVWPNGELMEFSEEQKSEEEKLKTKEDAIQSLGDFFGVVQTAVGADIVECSAREIVESLQCAVINRQLLFEVLEIILAEVFPELINDKGSYLSSRNC